MNKPILLPTRVVSEETGTLLALEIPDELEFTTRRIFSISGVEPGESRGHHAHRQCGQILTCVSGSLEVKVDDTNQGWTYLLNHQSQSLYIPAGLWGIQTYLEPATVLVVLASDHYDESDYFRDRTAYDSWVLAGSK